jgi:signal transduction histidine kinase
MLQGRKTPSTGAQSRARSTAASAAATPDHAVQFYETDAFLVANIARFVAAGLTAGQGIIVVATQSHREALLAALHRKRIAVAAEQTARRLVLCDAHELLASIVDAGTIDVGRFETAFSDTLRNVAPSARAVGLRVYGEMVDLLWKAGNAAAAIRLEELWNEHARTRRFSLLCAYAIRGFPATEHGAILAEICRHHTRVTPTEQFLERPRTAKRAEIVLLQQRAQALETELLYRKQLELRLRKTANAARRAKVDAEIASRAKNQFLTVMSHELRTPLNAIGGYAELLELGIHGPVSDEQRDSLERIQRNQRHLLGLINQVLDYSKLEIGRLRYDIGEVVIARVLAAVEAVARPRMTAKRLRYVAPSDSSLVVHADADKVQQILLNLLTNATKFTGDGGTIEVDCFADVARVYVNVRDTGVGIADERLATIFEPFVQTDEGYRRTTDGIGLGLAISRELARGMNGTLTVASVPGEGSTFTLALPRLIR